MISIAVPKSMVPIEEHHTFEEPLYSKGSFKRFAEVTFVDLCGHTLDDRYEDDEFFVELSGNEFVKLIEKDDLPAWATPESLFKHSTANGEVDLATRKITWIRPKTPAL